MERYNPPGLKFEGMSQAVIHNGLVYVSGQVALRNGAPVGTGDPEAQARQCFTNLDAVLSEAGAGLSDLILLRCYLTDAAFYPAYAQVKSELVGRHPPCGTAVIVKALLLPELLLEVEAVAAVSGISGSRK
ncbi:MAG: RidA family protein [Rhizobiaceae bacterium]|nr:RidA family protein [Rhizobiaceae bacterium]